MRLIRIFNRVRFASWNLRRKNPNADGRQFWQFIKNELQKYPIVADYGWKKLDEGICERLMAMEETCEVNHFLRQHANIPLNDPPSLTKIIQIALNSGQLMGSIIGHDYGNSEYLKDRLYDIRTYVFEDDIRDMSREIPFALEKVLDEYLKKYCIF
jgi:hypothetical protein